MKPQVPKFGKRSATAPKRPKTTPKDKYTLDTPLEEIRLAMIQDGTKRGADKVRHFLILMVVLREWLRKMSNS